MLPILLAGACALIWGAGDFCGGRAVQLGDGRRGLALSVTVVSQLCALPMIALFLLLVPGQFGVSALVWGALGGLTGFAGIALLYLALASGAMSVVAPTTAVTAAVVPMVGGLLMGERPGVLPLLGAGCAIAAIALVSSGNHPRQERVRPRVIGIALLSGSMFGLFFLLLAQAGEGAGMWPLAAARMAAIPVGLLLLKPLGGTLRIATRDATGRRAFDRRILPLTVTAGVLDLLANGFYLLAVYHGEISVLAPIASLYPASTVLLALLIQKERLVPLQVFGLGLAGAALVLAAT